ncbi:MAG TPA: oligosaccharide flippase family protein [Clostridia bacterium]|nr:oligosaccharide flippase family protein [Clostridia bacterium]
MSINETVLSGYKPRGWRGAVAVLRAQPGHRKLLSGSVVMLTGSTFVSLLNFGYNVAVARMLGPASFSHAAVAVTLLMLVSSITLSFQMVCAKFVARNGEPGAKAFVYRTLRRRAWIVGLVLGSAIALSGGLLSGYLRLPSRHIITLLAFGMAFYIPLGVKRGAMQGTCQFTKLAGNFALEAVTKFSLAVLLVLLGYGVLGAVAAIALSVALAYFVPSVGPALEGPAKAGIPASFREGMQAITFFVGQVIINNIDIVMVKHFFPPQEAGVYAAIALVGRVLYFASWSIVSAMFPISAGAKTESSHTVLIIPLLFITVISLGFILVLGFFPEFILRVLFGARFEPVGQGMNSLLSLYAASTAGYALSVVLIAYEMSRRIANSAWLQLVFSGLVMAGITFFHGSLREVVVVQQVLMVVLLIAVSIPFFRKRQIGLEAAA